MTSKLEELAPTMPECLPNPPKQRTKVCGSFHSANHRKWVLELAGLGILSDRCELCLRVARQELLKGK